MLPYNVKMKNDDCIDIFRIKYMSSINPEKIYRPNGISHLSVSAGVCIARARKGRMWQLVEKGGSRILIIHPTPYSRQYGDKGKTIIEAITISNYS